jgi:hypothetical protein
VSLRWQCGDLEHQYVIVGITCLLFVCVVSSVIWLLVQFRVYASVCPCGSMRLRACGRTVACVCFSVLLHVRVCIVVCLVLLSLCLWFFVQGALGRS